MAATSNTRSVSRLWKKSKTDVESRLDVHQLVEVDSSSSIEPCVSQGVQIDGDIVEIVGVTLSTTTVGSEGIKAPQTPVERSGKSGDASSKSNPSSIKQYFLPTRPLPSGSVVDLSFDEDDGLVEEPIEVSFLSKGDSTVSFDTEDAGIQQPKNRAERAASMNDFYRERLCKALSAIEESLLGDDQALEFRACIQTKLSVSAQVILARVLFLQGPWFRRSQASRYLERTGIVESAASEAVEELLRHGILTGLEDSTEDEWDAILDSSIVSKGDVLLLLRRFDPKAKSSETKDGLVERLRDITRNKNTIFGSGPISLRRHMEKVINSGSILKVSLDVFRMCRRAIMICGLFMDVAFSDDGDAIVAAGDVQRFAMMCRYRGGCRIPSCFSPGFIAVSRDQSSDGEDDDSFNDSEERFVLRRLYVSREQISRLEMGFELLCVAKVIANRVDEAMSDEDADDEDACVVDPFFIDQCWRTRVSMISLGKAAMALMNEWTSNGPGGHCEDPPPHLLPLCDGSFHLALVLEHALTALENQKQYTRARGILEYLLRECSSRAVRFHPRRARWWERLVVDLNHLSAREEALQACRDALHDPSLDPATDPDLFAIRVRLANAAAMMTTTMMIQEGNEDINVESCLLQVPVELKMATPFGKAGKGSGARGKQQFVAPVDAANVTCSVEDLALHLYAEEENGGWRGIHTENYAIREIFRLIMGKTLTGRTSSDEGKEALRQYLVENLALYQNRSLDLEAPFGLVYKNRQNLIDAKLAEIRSWDLAEIAKQIETAFGAQPERVKKQKLERGSLGTLQLIAMGLGPDLLASVCELMCKEYRNLGMGGAPDLVLVRVPDGGRALLDKVFDDERGALGDDDIAMLKGKEVEVKFVEVKSENDRLSDRQVAWLNALHSRGAVCEVLKIGVTGSLKVGRSIKKQRGGNLDKAGAATVNVEDDDVIFEEDEDET